MYTHICMLYTYTYTCICTHTYTYTYTYSHVHIQAVDGNMYNGAYELPSEAYGMEKKIFRLLSLLSCYYIII